MVGRAAFLLVALLASFLCVRAPIAWGAGSLQYAAANINVAKLLELNRQSLGAFVSGAYRESAQSVSSSGETWSEQSLWDGSDYRATVTQGDFTWSYGMYRGRAWHQDSNGLVMPSSGLVAETDPFATALRKAEEPTNSVKLLGMTPEAPPEYVVEVTPSNGLDERRYYDAQSYLLVRVEMTDYDGHRQVWLYRDYRMSSGRMLAGTIDYEGDGTSLTLRTTLTSCQRATLGSLDVDMPATRKLFDLGAHDAVNIPARFTDSGIVVPVSIAGRGLDFMLDSGSSDLLIDPEIARQLGMKSSGAMRVSFAGDYTLANARAPDLTVGDLRARGVAFSTASFQEDLPSQRIVGLLGTDFIGSGALRVDFEKKTLTLLRDVPPDLATQGWSVIPTRLDYGVPVVRATYSGLPGYFVADLGAYYSMLYPHYFSQFPNRIPRGMPDQDEMMTLGGRPFGVKHITMKQLILGDWVFGDVQVVVPSAQYAQDREEDGLIGLDTLSSFDVIFDYDHARLWFKPINFAPK